jgi:hypothetical protein
MASKACTPQAESEDTLPTEYSIYGPQLNVDALLRRSRPRGEHSVWRRGETTEFGEAQTSGITIPVFDGVSSPNLFRTVKRFLKRERAFLSAAANAGGWTAQRGLSTTIFVRSGHLPVGFQLPPALLGLAGQMRVAWAIMAIPCTADGTVAVGVPPSDNELQRTEQPMEPRR